MNVLKFGGSSVANAQNILKVLKVVQNHVQDSKVYVVVSALGGITDLLLTAGRLAASKDETYKSVLSKIEERHFAVIRELVPIAAQSGVISKVKSDLNALEALCEGAYLLSELSEKTTSVISSFGELLSSYIIAEVAKSMGMDLVLKDSRELIVAQQVAGKVVVDYEESNHRISLYHSDNSHEVVLLPGFVSRNANGDITTLGRGGSDYTAAIIAAAIDAETLYIYTDVSGMFTANPNLVRQAKPVDHISYQEAMELSHFGAKVIYPPTIQPILEKNIPIWIKNTFEPEVEGTKITREVHQRQRPVTGISHIDNISLLSLEGSGMVGIPGFSKRLFEALSLENINVILITQASSEHSICLVVDKSQAQRAKEILDTSFEYEITKHKVDPVTIEEDIAIVAVVGDSMINHQGLSGKMFSTLGKNNINIRAIAQGASERNISVVIAKKHIEKALNALHEEFFEVNTKQLNLFVTGVGNVGSKLLEQFIQQEEYLREKLRLTIRVIGISNSRNMIFNEDGIDLRQWETLLPKGNKANAEEFLEKAKVYNKRNTIFVDNTATPAIARMYKSYLKESIAVVTCNKIACADEYENYEQLQELSREYSASFLYETNVGAGLPVIYTLNNLIASGDRVRKIQAVLSGSLNFVFNTYSDETDFYTVVKQAQQEGYTEPDPKIDLSGIDVARKILILARESGQQLELSDIQNKPFLPVEALETISVDDFLKAVKESEPHFKEMLTSANANKARLKYVAEYEEGKASVGLQEITSEHPFYDLKGSDNIVLFYTDRYPQQPLIVKGAGAGAEVTASGIFADIIRVGKK